VKKGRNKPAWFIEEGMIGERGGGCVKSVVSKGAMRLFPNVLGQKQQYIMS